jgi:hypothetical protein
VWFSSVPSGECWDSTLKLDHVRIDLTSFQIIVHLSPFHCKLFTYKLLLSHYTPRRRLWESTSVLDRGEWSASSPGRALDPGKTPGTHCTGGWVGPRAGLDTKVRGKILCLCQGSNLDRPVIQPVARHYIDWATRLTKLFSLSYWEQCR